MKRLFVNSGHVSHETHVILERRDRPAGTSFTRNGDRALPFLGEMTFPVKSFSADVDVNPGKLERAFPRDLWFLHMVAHHNGFDEIVVSPHAPRHDALPWYDGTNRILEPGEILARQKIRKAHKIPRQSESRVRVESVATRQILEDQADLHVEMDLMP